MGRIFWGAYDGVDVNLEDASSITDIGAVERHINNLVLVASFIGVSELKEVGTDLATIANMASRDLTMVIYVVRAATRAVNGYGCNEELIHENTHHIDSTERRHHQSY